MIMYKIFASFLLLTLLHNRNIAQAPSYDPNLDVQSYRFELALGDQDDSLHGKAAIRLAVREAADSFHLALQEAVKGKGMTVSSFVVNGSPLSFRHANGRIGFATGAKAGDTLNLVIEYAGIPADGLIIGKNKFGHRSFFGDNWPDRAHQWLPCNDHPADKATVSFRVTAPAAYKVIANGRKILELSDGKGMAVTEWEESARIPAKVMVMGLANFSIDSLGTIDGIPVSAWTYPQDRDKGKEDMSQAVEILPFFIKTIGPYPFEKLANVQSTTIFGGMENAGCIFYDENAVKGGRSMENLLAHEIAHQWFGNGITEKSWADFWLSEGFATYFADLYVESRHGVDSARRLLAQQRESVIGFYRKQPKKAVIDSLETNKMALLNANSYQKGAWVLHMLRQRMGDDHFNKLIKTYYAGYGGGNAGTEDFRRAAEETCACSLKDFFDQWLYRPGHPQMEIRWKSSKKEVSITVIQQQDGPFKFPLRLRLKNGSRFTTVDIEQTGAASNTIVRPRFRVKELVVDPNTALLGEWKIIPVK